MAIGSFIYQPSPQRIVFGAGTLAQLPEEVARLGLRRVLVLSTPGHKKQADDDGDHMLVRTVECIEGRVEVELVCEPVFDYGRAPAEWTLVGDDRHTADASGAAVPIRLRSDLLLGIEGNRVRGRHVLEQGERAYCCLTWAEGLTAPEDADEAYARIAATRRFWRGWIGSRQR